MNISVIEKSAAIEREYPEMYDGVAAEVKAGRYPQLWGLSSERALEWGYDSPKDLKTLLSIVYDELSNLGRFGEDARKENYVFQHIQDADYKLLKDEFQEASLRKFVGTYGVLMWVVLVSSDNKGQKNIIRALFLLYGSRGEKEAALVGVKKLPSIVINAINDLETAKLVVETIPSLLKRVPITVNNYLEDLPKLSRWEALGLVATGQFLEDDPSLKNGILTRYYEHVKSIEEKSSNQFTRSIPKYTAFKRVMAVTVILAPTGIIHPATENYDVLNDIVMYSHNEPIWMPSVHWEEYNPTRDSLKLFKIKYLEIIIKNHPNVNIATIIISPHDAYRELMSNSLNALRLLRYKYVDMKIIMWNIVYDRSLKANVIKAILNNEDVMTIIEKSNDTKGFWTVNAICNPPAIAKLIRASITISWDDILYALNISHEGFRYNALDDYDVYKNNLLYCVNFESLYYLLKTIDPTTITPDTNNILFKFIKILADDSPTKAKKLVRFIIDNRLYISVDEANDLAKKVSLKFK